MFELIAFIGFFFILGTLAIVLLKVLLVLLILPFKLAFWMARGFLAFIIVIPLAVIFFNIFSFAFPFLILLMFLPLMIGIAALVLLFKYVF